jgi:hypothetical protein
MPKLIRRTPENIKPKEHDHFSKKGSGITALIDMDVICYSVGFAAQTNIHKVRVVDKQGVATFETKKEMNIWLAEKELGPDDYTVETEIIPDPIENALHSVKVMLNSILEAVDAEYYKGYLTGKGNFRERVAVTQPYKGNRKDFIKPIHFDAIKEYLINVWGAIVVEGKEADDAMAIAQVDSIKNLEYLQEHPGVCLGSIPKKSTIICSIDKDLMMVSGWHYNWNKDEKVFVNPDEGLSWFFKQWLMGDSTDNIKGLSGIGPKKAEAILEGLTIGEQLCAVGLWYAIKEDDPEARMQEDGQLLWMMRIEGDHFDLMRMINSGH